MTSTHDSNPDVSDAAQDAATGDTEGGKQPTLTQEEVNRLVGLARVEARKAFLKRHGIESEEAFEALISEAKEIKERSMTEAERLQAKLEKAVKRAEEAEAQLERMRLEAMRARIGREKGLPEPIIARMVATDEESARQEADELLEALKTISQPSDIGGGTRPPGGEASDAVMGDPLAVAISKAIGRRRVL